jgi:Fe-S cluster biosynthesis and repair protein YggX
MARMVFCEKFKQELEGLDYHPIAGVIGDRIYNHISKQAWFDWVKQQTMIINENRLNLSEESARKYLNQQMEYFLFGSSNT